MRKSIFTPEQRRLQALLRQIRKEAGLTQVELARALGRYQSFVSNFESGERRLDILELRQVCAVLGLSLEEFARRLERELRQVEEAAEAERPP